MPRPFHCLLAAGVLVFAALSARAEHFEITLTVEGSGAKVEAHADSSPPFEGTTPRPVFRGHVGDDCVFQFFMTDANPHTPLLHVKVRYYVVSQTATAPEPPAAGSQPIAQGEFVLDFKPDSRIGLRQHFRINHSGLYLLRVESDGSHSDHEHFSAIDLRIE